MEISNKLSKIAQKLGYNFTLKGRPLTFDEMFSENGLLPGLSRRADQLASLCLGYGLGASYQDEEKALLGVRVSFDEYTPDILRVFCIIDVLCELAKSSPSRDAVPLDELMYD